MRYGRFLTAAILLLPAQALGQAVTIGTARQYDAGGYTLDPADLQGFERALGEDLCDRADLSCEWSVMARADLLPALASGEVDVVMAGIAQGSDLGEGIATTVAYLYPDPYIIAGFPGMETFTGLRSVASVPDPAVEAWRATTGYRLDLYPTLAEALEAVATETVDGVIGEAQFLGPLVAASDGRFEVITRNDRMHPGVTMALRAGDIDLRFSLEDRIYDMTLDGSLNALTEAWFGEDAARW